MGGLACADCHGARAEETPNPDWLPPGHALGGVAERETLWNGLFKDDDRVRDAGLWCAARFQYRIAGDLPRGEDRRPDLTAVPLSDEDRTLLTHYVTSLAPAVAVAVATLPKYDYGDSFDPENVLGLVGDRDRGERVWMASCAVCHGDDGEGGLGPGVVGAEVLEGWDFVSYIRGGGNSLADGEWMPWFDKTRLSDQDLADLAIRWAE